MGPPPDARSIGLWAPPKGMKTASVPFFSHYSQWKRNLSFVIPSNRLAGGKLTME